MNEVFVTRWDSETMSVADLDAVFSSMEKARENISKHDTRLGWEMNRTHGDNATWERYVSNNKNVSVLIQCRTIGV